jgi:hypothetical protein
MKTLTFYNNTGIAFTLIERADGGVIYVDGNYSFFYTRDLHNCGMPLELLDLLCDKKPPHIIDFLLSQRSILIRYFPRILLKEF